MAGWTNKEKYRILGDRYRNIVGETNFYVALCTSATPPTQDINTLSELTEIAAGNGYATGGFSLTPGATDYDVWTEDDTNDWSLIQMKDIVWTASGGPIPSAGGGARWAVHTDDNVTIGSREVYQYFDLTSDRTVSDAQTLTLQDCEIRITE